METLAIMKALVGKKINKTDSTFLDKIEGFLNSRYEDIWDRHNWPQKSRKVTAIATADAETMIIDANDLDYIVDIHDRVNNIDLNSIDASRGGRGHVDSQDESGIPNFYWYEKTTVRAQPSAASVLALVSSNNNDTSQKVRIWGRDANNNQINELVSLNGTNSKNSTLTYTTVDEVTKDSNTAGVVTITSNSAAVTVARINPSDYKPSYVEIHLVKRPDSAISYTVTYKRAFRRLVNAEDVPLIPCQGAMKIGGYADTLYEQKKYAEARAVEQNPINEWDGTTYEGAINNLIFKYDVLRQNVVAAQPDIRKDEIDNVPNHLRGF